MHHIVSDGCSMGVLNRELAVLYEALSHAQPAPLPELAVQYGDCSLWQRQWLKGAELERRPLIASMESLSEEEAQRLVQPD